MGVFQLCNTVMACVLAIKLTLAAFLLLEQAARNRKKSEMERKKKKTLKAARAISIMEQGPPRT